MTTLLDVHKRERYDQLSLTFDFTKPIKGKNYHIDKDEINKFLEFGPDNSLNLYSRKHDKRDPYRRITKLVNISKHHQEFIFPQRLKPYHNKIRTSDIVPIVRDFILCCPSLPHSKTKDPIVNIPSWVSATYGPWSGFFPYKMSIKEVPRTNRIVQDLSFEIKYSNTGDAVRVEDPTWFRCWIHSELVWNANQKRHLIDHNKSIAYCWMGRTKDSGNSTWNVNAYKLWDEYALTHNLFTHGPIILRHAGLRAPESKSQKLSHEFLKNASSKIIIGSPNILPENIENADNKPRKKLPGAGVKPILANPYKYDAYSGHTMRWGQKYVNPRTTVGSGGKLTDWFAEMLPYSSSPAVVNRNFLIANVGMSNAEISSGWIKLLNVCIAKFGGAAAGSYSTNESALISNFVKNVRDFCIYYEDQSFLAYVLSSVMKFEGRIIFYTLELDALKRIVHDSLFQSFPRSKQFSLLLSCLVEDSAEQYKREVLHQERARTTWMNDPHNRGQRMPERFAMPMRGNDNMAHLLRDLPGIIQQITARKVKTADKIKTRDVKSIKDYHDEATKVLNAIKHAPIPIEKDSFKFLEDWGLGIPDTDYEFVVPEDTNEIRTWGQKQNHCIASYADAAMKKQCLILGVRHKESGEWLGHMQLYARGLTTKFNNGSYRNPSALADGDLYITQFYGARNTSVPQPQRSQVLSHLEKAYMDFKAKKEEEEKEEEKAKKSKANKREKTAVN